MKILLPTDRKAIAIAAWLFYSERGFSTELIHNTDDEDIELRIVYEDDLVLPHCDFIASSPFSCEITRLAYSMMVCVYHIPEVFI